MVGKQHCQINLVRMLGILCIGFLLSSCSAYGDPLWLDAPGWGRAFHITDVPAGQPVDFVEGDDGEVYFLLPENHGGEYTARVVAVNEHLEQVWQQDNTTALPRPLQVDVHIQGGALVAFWAGDEELHHLAFDPSRDQASVDEVIAADFPIQSFAAGFSNAGDLTLLAAGPEEEPGMYRYADGEWSLLDPLGLTPSIQFDVLGGVHAIWWHDDRIEGDNGLFYAAADAGNTEFGEPVRLTDISLNPADGIEGPFFGIEDGYGYVFWTQLFRTGLRAGTIEASYISFELSHPVETLSEAVLQVPVGYDLSYEAFPDGDLRAGFRYTWLPGEIRTTADITDIQVLDRSEGELAVSLRARTAYLRSKSEEQVAVLFFDDGEPTSYQLLSFTAGNSAHPVIHADELGYLSVAWIEDGPDGSGGVYFSSLEPGYQRALDKLTWTDYKNAISDTLLGMVSGLVLFPFALIWFVLPVVMIFVTGKLRAESRDLRSPGEIISLLLIVAAYWLSRQIILPGMWNHIPFAAWWPMLPPVLEHVFPWLVPLLITVGSFTIAWKNTYERGQRSFLYLTLLFMVVDAVMTMAIYGGIIIGAF